MYIQEMELNILFWHSRCSMNLSNSMELVQFWLISIIAPKMTIIAHFSLSRWDSATLVEIFMHLAGLVYFSCSYGRCFMSRRVALGKSPHTEWEGQNRPCHAQGKPKHHLCSEYHIQNQHWDHKLQSGVQSGCISACINPQGRGVVKEFVEWKWSTCKHTFRWGNCLYRYCYSKNVMLSWVENVILQGNKNTHLFWRPA